ncbi:hypothetical protein D3C86_1945480 [compost metagenome]
MKRPQTLGSLLVRPSLPPTPATAGASLASGFTRCGVTTIISSRSSWWKFRFLKKLPRIGRSPRKGILLTLLTVLRLTSPPMTKLSPSPSSTVVSARRVVIEGICTPFSAIELV